MTYRELLELYKAGELELEQRKKVEKDIERQEAISDYLYEQEDVPELNDIFEEKNVMKKNNTTDAIDTEFIKMVNRSIKHAFRRLALTILAAAFVLILFVQFCLPTLVSCFYYNPTEKIGKDIHSNIKMSRDMAVYSELFLPGKRRMSVSAEAEGYGKYNILVNQTASLTGNLTNVSGEIIRGKLRYYDSNILSKPVSNVFVYGGAGSIVGDENKTVEKNLQTTKKYYNLKDNEEVNLCAAGTKEDSLKTLKQLDSKKLYIGYVSLDKYMSYEDFKKYIDKQDLSEVWCAVKVSEATSEAEEDEKGVDSTTVESLDGVESGKNELTHIYNFCNIGFVCNPSYTTEMDWDNKKYPNLLPGCETKNVEDNDYWSKMKENLKAEKNAKQHFISLLNYLADRKQFLTMMEGKSSEYSPEILKAMASYIKKNGLKIYGFTTIANRADLLKISKQNEVYEIYTEEIK